MVESCRNAKPLLRCVCLSLMRRTLEGERVANGAKADKMASNEVCGPRFLSIRAGVGEDERIIVFFYTRFNHIIYTIIKAGNPQRPFLAYNSKQ